MLTGSIVAIVTPMQDDGRLDYPRFKALIDFHIEQGPMASSSSAPPASRRPSISTSTRN